MHTTIGVIGASKGRPEDLPNAFEVGRLIAERGAVLVCGGLGGVMREAARGAKSAGGLTVGILPGEDARDANPFIDIPIVTGMGYARNIIVVRTSRVAIAIGGAYGTLSEIAYALNLRVPLVGLGSWDVPRIDRMPTAMEMAATPQEAVERVCELANQIT